MQTQELLDKATDQLHNQLAKLDLDDAAPDITPDRAINTISLIVRTLDKIDQLGKTLNDNPAGENSELTKEQYDQLKKKTFDLIDKAINREKQRQQEPIEEGKKTA